MSESAEAVRLAQDAVNDLAGQGDGRVHSTLTAIMAALKAQQAEIDALKRIHLREDATLAASIK